jgi:hypothetical protein
MRRLLAAMLASLAVYAIAPNAPAFEPPARRGCCSHHQGVCGCEGGRTICCDGVTSPTCTC